MIGKPNNLQLEQAIQMT